MKTQRTSLVVLVLLLGLGSCAVPKPEPPPPMYDFDLQTLVPQSDFIFAGTIVQTRTSTIDTDEVGNLAVVRVDQILSAAPPFERLTSELITVALADPDKASPGDKRTFFTRGWYFGESIATAEVGTGATTQVDDTKQLETDIERVRREQVVMKLRERLSRTELVVSGRVVGVRKSEIEDGLTEHGADWHEAIVRIDKVLKGNTPGPDVTVLFARSNDVVWFRAPKYDEGVEGVFLLRPFDFGGERLKFPAVVEPDDFLPMTRRAEVESLLVN